MRYLSFLLLCFCFLKLSAENVVDDLEWRHADGQDGVSPDRNIPIKEGVKETERHFSLPINHRVQSGRHIRGSRIRTICKEDPSYPLCRHHAEATARDVIWSTSLQDIPGVSNSIAPSSALSSAPSLPADSEPTDRSPLIPTQATEQPATTKSSAPSVTPSMGLNSPVLPVSDPASTNNPGIPMMPTLSMVPSSPGTQQPSTAEGNVPSTALPTSSNDPRLPVSNSYAPSDTKIPTLSTAPSSSPVLPLEGSSAAKGLPAYAYALTVLIPAVIVLVILWWCRSRHAEDTEDELENKRLRSLDDGSATTLLSGSLLHSPSYSKGNDNFETPPREDSMAPHNGDIAVANDRDDVSVLSVVGEREYEAGDEGEPEKLQIVGIYESGDENSDKKEAKKNDKNDDKNNDENGNGTSDESFTLGDFGSSGEKSLHLEFSRELDDLSIDSQLEYSSNESGMLVRESSSSDRD